MAESSAPIATVQSDSFLTLHYRLAGAQGDVINTFADAPATLQMGGGELVEELEQRLLGLAEGSHTRFELPAGSVFGEADPARRQWVASSALCEAEEQPAERYVGEDIALRAEINAHPFDLASSGSPAFQAAHQRIHRLLFDDTIAPEKEAAGAYAAGASGQNHLKRVA